MCRKPSPSQLMSCRRVRVLGLPSASHSRDGKSVRVAAIPSHVAAAVRAKAERFVLILELPCTFWRRSMLTEFPDVTNPKDRLGLAKPPLHLIPPAAEILEAEVMGLGARKYGVFGSSAECVLRVAESWTCRCDWGLGNTSSRSQEPTCPRAYCTNGTRLVAGLKSVEDRSRRLEAAARRLKCWVRFGFSLHGTGLTAAGAEADAGINNQRQSPR